MVTRQKVALRLATAGLIVGGLALLRLECNKVEKKMDEFNAPNNGPAKNSVPHKDARTTINFAKFQLMKEDAFKQVGNQPKT